MTQRATAKEVDLAIALLVEDVADETIPDLLSSLKGKHVELLDILDILMPLRAYNTQYSTDVHLMLSYQLGTLFSTLVGKKVLSIQDVEEMAEKAQAMAQTINTEEEENNDK